MKTPRPENRAKEEVKTCGIFDRDLLWENKSIPFMKPINLKKHVDGSSEKNIHLPHKEGEVYEFKPDFI